MLKIRKIKSFIETEPSGSGSHGREKKNTLSDSWHGDVCVCVCLAVLLIDALSFCTWCLAQLVWRDPTGRGTRVTRLLLVGL